MLNFFSGIPQVLSVLRHFILLHQQEFVLVLNQVSVILFHARLFFLVFVNTCITCVPCSYQSDYFYIFVIGPLVPAVTRSHGKKGRARVGGHGHGGAQGRGRRRVVAVANDQFQSYDDIDRGNQMPPFAPTRPRGVHFVKSYCVGP